MIDEEGEQSVVWEDERRKRACVRVCACVCVWPHSNGRHYQFKCKRTLKAIEMSFIDTFNARLD